MKIPITIFSGFLGAGKTTLISDLIRQCHDRHFAVIVNEFGAISIDGDAVANVEHPHAQIYNLTNTLVGYGSDNSLGELLNRIAETGTADHIVIETSGLAVPTAIIEQLPRLSRGDRFILDSVVTVVDTPWLLDAHPMTAADATGDVFVRQLNASDIVVLNKIDSLTDNQLLEAEQLLRSTAPAVRFVELAHHAHVDSTLTLGVHLHEVRGQTRHQLRGQPATGSETVFEGHSHSGLSPHDHGLLTHEHLHEHDPSWLSFSLETSQAQDSQALFHALEEVCKQEPVLRAKGHVRTTGDRLIGVQCVRDRVSLHEDTGELHTHSQLVFIGYDLDRQSVIDRICRLTSTIWS